MIIMSLAATLLVTLLGFTGIWLIHVKIHNAGVADFYWGPGFAVIAALSGWMNGFSPVSAVLTGAVLLWAVRLSAYLIVRHRKSAGEDARYAAMRRAGGSAFWWKSLFSVFLLQGFLQWVIASPLHAAFLHSQVGDLNSALFVLGLIVFASGFAIEWMADSQLAKFRNASALAGRLCTSGLWSLSRHPNYLGEIMLWFGIALTAFSFTHSLTVFIGPLVLAGAIVYVSIPLTEDHMRKSRPQFDAYAARTPILIPSVASLRQLMKA